MDTLPIFTLFERAISHNLKYPKIRLLSADNKVVVLRMNGSKSRYPGTIAVTDDRPFGVNSYYGRIERTGVVAGRDYTPAIALLIEALACNPVEVAQAYGKLTGNCCFCQLPLTDLRSTIQGYGPVCADKWELPWGMREVAA